MCSCGGGGGFFCDLHKMQITGKTMKSGIICNVLIVYFDTKAFLVEQCLRFHFGKIQTAEKSALSRFMDPNIPAAVIFLTALWCVQS